MRRFFQTFVSAALALAGLSISGPPVHGATTWTVAAGGGTSDDAVQAYVFGPTSITIDEGDTVTWQIGSGEPHTISFGYDNQGPPPPLTTPQVIGQFIERLESPAGVTPGATPSWSGTGQLSSGIVGADPNPSKSFSVTFPKAGSYNYLCLFHPPNMKGTVVVQAAGTPYPQTQQQVSAAGSQQTQAAVAKGQGVLPTVNAITKKTSPDGSTSWTVPAGVGTLDSAILRFGSPLAVKVGDTVTWVDQDPATPHTVTFTPGGQPLAPADEPIPESSIVGGGSYAGSGLFSSGLLGPIPGLKQSYSLKFTTPGTFQYRCLLHDDEGMVASITVTGGAPVQAPVQAPTG
jgi:plastocyanin